VKRSWWCGVVILLLPSCAYVGRMLGQKHEGPVPPKTMRVCIGNDCEDAVWASDHYEGHQNGEVSNRYWITAWRADHVELSMKAAKAGDGVFPIEGTMTGAIAPDGAGVPSGSFDWRIGYTQSGTLPFTLAWATEAAANAKVRGNTGKTQAPLQADDSAEERRFATYQPHRVNGILVPPGASDAFASFPDDVRAILLPEHALLPSDAVRPCDDTKEDDTGTGISDPIVALEIGRFALRAGEFTRGHCWISHSGTLNQNPRAMVLIGIIHLMGWRGPKDSQLAFRYFDGEFQTHDPWALYFVEQSYINGVGVAKNIPRAGQIDSYLMTHNNGQNVFMMIGADDAAVIQRYQKISALMNPPTMAKTECSIVPNPKTLLGVERKCSTTYEVDHERLQRRLDSIDREYSNTVNQKP
jgi:hypothetical protein